MYAAAVMDEQNVSRDGVDIIGPPCTTRRPRPRLLPIDDIREWCEDLTNGNGNGNGNASSVTLAHHRQLDATRRSFRFFKARFSQFVAAPAAPIFIYRSLFPPISPLSRPHYFASHHEPVYTCIRTRWQTRKTQSKLLLVG